MESTPARIHLMPAREAPYVAVIRRKPSRLYHILRWNTETDEIEQGSWFDGTIYEEKADISFDGEWMVYLASGRGKTWTGLCKLPRLTTLFDLENVSTYGGGGVFTSANRLELNLAPSMEVPSAIFRVSSAGLPFQVRVMQGMEGSEVDPTLIRRFERDGYSRTSSVEGDSNRVLPTWEFAPTTAHPTLRIRYIWHPTHNGQSFAFDLPDVPGFLDSQVSWAAYDSLGQLIVARRGILLRYTLEGIESWMASASIDLEQLQPQERYVKEAKEAADDRQIRAIVGVLEEQPVKVLVVPTAKVHWAERIRDLAGDAAQAEAVTDVGTCRVGDAYYLRQHYLVHTHEPPVAAKATKLGDFCRLVFEAASLGSSTSTVATRLIGCSSGWSLATSINATIEAALAFIDGYASRRVFLVAEDQAELAEISKALSKKGISNAAV